MKKLFPFLLLGIVFIYTSCNYNNISKEEYESNVDIEKYIYTDYQNTTPTKEIPERIQLIIYSYSLNAFTNGQIGAGKNQNLTSLFLRGKDEIHPNIKFSIIYFTNDTNKLGKHWFDPEVSAVYTYMDYKELPTALEILNKDSQPYFNYARIGEYEYRKSSSYLTTKVVLNKH